MKILFDTDLISSFSKIEKIDLLKKLFDNIDLCISFEVFKELLVPLDYGYSFPKTIFNKCQVIYCKDDERELFQNRLLENKFLGKGELESIIICQSRNFFFSAIDQKAIDYAQNQGITIFPLKLILRLLWKQGILSKPEVRGLISELEHKDKLMIKFVDDIFED